VHESDFDPVARALRPLLAEHAEQCETQRRIPAGVIAALHESDLFKMMYPRRAGGPGTLLITHLETVAELAVTAQQRPLTGFDKATIQTHCGYAMGLLRKAVDELMDIAGPAAFATASPLQRFWRDVSLGSRHNALNTRLSLELYGRALTGLESNLALLANVSR
jgi:alkylation response protein AidB-like acyl-CoA dehydrogenase